VTLDVGTISRITRGTDVRTYEKLPVVIEVVDTMPVQYGHLPVVNSATLFMDTTAASVTSLWTTVSPSCRHVLLPVFSMIAANQLQRNCVKCVLHSLSDRYPVVEEVVQGPAPAPVVVKTL
jgi:PII-like signaling protein